jgi:hypothetical protein
VIAPPAMPSLWQPIPAMRIVFGVVALVMKVSPVGF